MTECAHEWGRLSVADGPVVREVCVKCGEKRDRPRLLSPSDRRFLHSLRIKWEGD